MYLKNFNRKHDVTSYFVILEATEIKNSIFFHKVIVVGYIVLWVPKLLKNKLEPVFFQYNTADTHVFLKKAKTKKKDQSVIENPKLPWSLRLSRFTLPRCLVEKTFFETIHLKHLRRVLI